MITVLLNAIILTFYLPDLAFAEIKVVGGREALKGEYPFLVSLQWKTHGHFCGGNLITFDKILTACHCMCSFRTGQPFMFLVKDIIAVAGVENYKSNNRQVRQVHKSERHVKCGLGQGGGWEFDYGIYTLAKPLSPFYRGNTIKTIPVYSSDPAKVRNKIEEIANASTVCQGAGWGFKTVEYDTASEEYIYKDISEQLKAINVTIRKQSTCQDELCQEPVKQCLPEGELGRRKQWCAMAPKQEDVCEGDSGGPLVCLGFVIGILSWGPACGEHAYPSMYNAIDEVYNLEMFSSSESIGMSTALLTISIFILINNV